MTEILVKKFNTRDPKFNSPVDEGRFERDLRIDRDMRKADKAVYDVMKDRVKKVGTREDWDISSIHRYRENYEKIDWKK